MSKIYTAFVIFAMNFIFMTDAVARRGRGGYDVHSRGCDDCSSVGDDIGMYVWGAIFTIAGISWVIDRIKSN